MKTTFRNFVSWREDDIQSRRRFEEDVLPELRSAGVKTTFSCFVDCFEDDLRLASGKTTFEGFADPYGDDLLVYRSFSAQTTFGRFVNRRLGRHEDDIRGRPCLPYW